MNTSEAARQLGVSDRQVRRLLETGKLPGSQSGEPGRNGARGSVTWDITPQGVQAYIALREQAKRERRDRWLAMRRSFYKPMVFDPQGLEQPQDDY